MFRREELSNNDLIPVYFETNKKGSTFFNYQESSPPPYQYGTNKNESDTLTHTLSEREPPPYPVATYTLTNTPPDNTNNRPNIDFGFLFDAQNLFPSITAGLIVTGSLMCLAGALAVSFAWPIAVPLLISGAAVFGAGLLGMFILYNLGFNFSCLTPSKLSEGECYEPESLITQVTP